MMSTTKLIASLATLTLPFTGLAPAFAQVVVIAPPSAGGSTIQTPIVTRVHRHGAVHRQTMKPLTSTRPSKITFRGPLHTKKVAPMTLNVPLVWVNVPTGVYHYPGSASYGKSENGKYMTEADALKEHYRAAWNNQ